MWYDLLIWYWIHIDVSGLRFVDLVICPAFALQGLCRVLEPHKRTARLELGIWKISGDLGWTSVLIPDIQWLCGWISGDWPWLAHGNQMAQIRPVSLQFSTQECGNRERQFLRNSGQLAKMIFANICYTYIRKWIHMCMIMWHTWHIDRLTVPFLNQYTYDYICN